MIRFRRRGLTLLETVLATSILVMLMSLMFWFYNSSLETRQEFVDRLIFYNGRLLSVELGTALLEEYARPRPMTVEERRALLQQVFAVSTWGTD